VEFLLNKGAKVDLANREGWTALAYAVTVRETEKQAEASGIEIVKLLIANGANVNARFNHFQDGERTVLMQAIASTETDDPAKKGYLAVEMLVAKGAKVDDPDGAGRTALMYAVRAAKTRLVELLLAKGAKVDAQDRDSETVLMYAVRAGKPELVDLLLKSKANPTLRNKDQKTALDIARDEGRKALVDALTAAGGAS
jgi:uncharacterized protein